MKAQISNHNDTVKSAANYNSGFDVHLQIGRRLHDKEIGRFLVRYIAKFFEFFGKEDYSYQSHAGYRA